MSTSTELQQRKNAANLARRITIEDELIDKDLDALSGITADSLNLAA